ncbi:hypothetical protein, partial [Gluconobacter sphaericus]|uniref:hypothetical protein n=1 Tax=Gluconobacter sphaericus TaxID=574987 RepID=UPI001B8BF57D
MAKTHLRWKHFCFLCLAMSVSFNSSSASGVLLPLLKAPTIPEVPAGKTVPLLDASKTEKLSAHIWMIPGYPRLRGQRLTVTSVIDSTLSFGGVVGR